MTAYPFCRVSAAEFKAIRQKAKAKAEKRAEKRTALPWAGRKRVKAPTARKISRKGLISRLDAAFSIKVRIEAKKAFGRCPFHDLTTFRPIEDCFHFITRSKHSIRWDYRNATGSCRGCNIRYEHDQTFVDFVFDWYKKRYGQDTWDRLKRDGNIIADFSVDDLRKKLAAL